MNSSKSGLLLQLEQIVPTSQAEYKIFQLLPSSNVDSTSNLDILTDNNSIIFDLNLSENQIPLNDLDDNSSYESRYYRGLEDKSLNHASLNRISYINSATLQNSLSNTPSIQSNSYPKKYKTKIGKLNYRIKSNVITSLTDSNSDVLLPSTDFKYIKKDSIRNRNSNHSNDNKIMSNRIGNIKIDKHSNITIKGNNNNSYNLDKHSSNISNKFSISTKLKGSPRISNPRRIRDSKKNSNKF